MCKDSGQRNGESMTANNGGGCYRLKFYRRTSTISTESTSSLSFCHLFEIIYKLKMLLVLFSVAPFYNFLLIKPGSSLHWKRKADWTAFDATRQQLLLSTCTPAVIAVIVFAKAEQEEWLAASCHLPLATCHLLLKWHWRIAVERL